MTTIPRILHQIWLGPAQMPEKYSRWRDGFIRMNPDWECRLWTDDTLPPILNRRAWDIARSLPGTTGHAIRSDILRLELLARFGGVYLDTDVRPVRPLDEVCDVPAWIAREQADRVSNAAMGFPPNHPAMWRAVVSVDESFFRHRRVVDQAGPTLVRRVLLRYPDIVFYPPHYFTMRVREVRQTPGAHLVLKADHQFNATWCEHRMHRHRDLWEQTGVDTDAVLSSSLAEEDER